MTSNSEKVQVEKKDVEQPAQQQQQQQQQNAKKKANFPRQKPDFKGQTQPKPKNLSTTATTLTNDPLWSAASVMEGERGLVSEEAIKTFSADAAGYVFLVEQEYNALSDCDKFVPKTVPKSAFAHYHHILWWYKMALTAQNRGTASPAQEQLIHFVNGYDIRLGSGAATYLSGMGDFVDTTGVKHYIKAIEPNNIGL